MTSRSSFIRKIIYLLAIAALLMPLYWLSNPATNDGKGEQGSPGGKLAQLRDKHDLSQARLGQVDPTSVTMKLATLGLRGVATNILWAKATDFKMKKDWTNFGATLNQITKLQPNFINVWSNQTWNLAYNCSVEFDDYRQRYRWVMKGIDFLKEGIKYNKRQPRLLWDMGWTISQKIGKSDEQREFRKLFKEDDDFHGSRPVALRDNWLVGKKWFEDVVAMVNEGHTMMSQSPLTSNTTDSTGKSPVLYRRDGPMCQMSYAEYLEKDGTFGEVAKAAWIGAANEWKRYGEEEIRTVFEDNKGNQIFVRLGEEEMRMDAARKLAAQLDALQPGLREKIRARKREALPKNQREALDTPAENRTPRQYALALEAEEAIKVTHNEVALQIKGARHEEAKELSKQAAANEEMADYIRRYRSIVNFAYWRLRAQVEQTDEMIEARRLLHEGDLAHAESDLTAARSAYERGMQGWRKVLDKAPSLVADVATGEDLLDVIHRYQKILDGIGTPFPKPFILQDVLDVHEKNPPAMKREKAPAKAKKGAG